MEQSTPNNFSWEQLQNLMADILLSQKETEKRFQETDKLLTEKFQDTDKKFQDTDKQFKDTDKKIKSLANLYTTQWGKLIEALMLPPSLKLFKERNIDIHQAYSRVIIQRGGMDEAEFDIVLANGSEIVVVDVKTTMKIEYINEFIEKMENIHSYFPKWTDCKFYGAVAAIQYDEGSHKYAYRKGLYVITNSGEGILKIANDLNFKPYTF